MGLVTFLYLSVPFISVGGRPLLRIDIADSALYAFGAIVPFDNLFPLLLAVLSLLFLFLFIAAGFGRLWCGWACPQTILSEFAELAILKKFKGRALHPVILQSLFLVASVIFATVTCLYFVDVTVFLPPAFLARFGWGSGTWAVLVLLFYGDIAFVRRIFCKQLCPYGAILTVVTDETGLRVAMDPEARKKDKCLQCAECVVACPMDLDVRKGSDSQCIQCGLCIEACNKSFTQLAPEGIIHYYLGEEGKRGGRIISTRSLVPLSVALVLAAALMVITVKRPQARFTVRMSANAAARELSDGRTARFFTANLKNTSGETRLYSIRVVDPGGTMVETRGQGQNIRVEAGDRARAEFAVVQNRDGPPIESLRFELIEGKGDVVGTVIFGRGKP